MASLLLDTNILLPMLEDELEALPVFVRAALEGSNHSLFASVASLWEAAIKHRAGRLSLKVPPSEWPDAFVYMRIGLYDVNAAHATIEVRPWPRTKDPFDRLLLAVCLTENLRLVTVDTGLRDHPLAYRPSA